MRLPLVLFASVFILALGNFQEISHTQTEISTYTLYSFEIGGGEVGLEVHGWICVRTYVAYGYSYLCIHVCVHECICIFLSITLSAYVNMNPCIYPSLFCCPSSCLNVQSLWWFLHPTPYRPRYVIWLFAKNKAFFFEGGGKGTLRLSSSIYYRFVYVDVPLVVLYVVTSSIRKG